MTPEMQGYNLWDVVKALKIDKAVLVPDQYQYLMGYPHYFMADVYNSADVLLSATMGEGFGIPILEAQACGTPVIVGGWTAMEELCFAGWKLDKDTESIPWMTPLGTNQFVPSVNAIEAYLEQAYDMATKDRYALREQAATAAKEYDYRKVFNEYWQPALRTIERKLLDERAKALKKGSRVV